MFTLDIQHLSASIAEKGILKDLNLTVKQGEIHAIMGPNGSGKSTLSKVILGHPHYQVNAGQILLNGEDITTLSPDKRARKGLFLAFQSPQKIPGLPTSQFLRSAYNAQKKEQAPEEKPASVFQFKKLLEDQAKKLHMDETLTQRYLNEGFSGGEMKKTEILQMSLLKPKIAILDEIDSGLDIDALRIVCQNIQAQYEEQKLGLLLITHYYRILDYVVPDFVHIMVDGKIIRSGDASLAKEVEEKGYTKIMKELGLTKESKLKVVTAAS